MKPYYLLPALVCYVTLSLAQPATTKPVIDTGVFDKWPIVRQPKISANGQYVSYIIYNKPVFSQTLVVQSGNGKKRLEFPFARDAVFTDDGRRAIFIRGKDSLCILTLGTNRTEYIDSVKAFRLFKQEKREWLAYQSFALGKSLVLRQMSNNKVQTFSGVTSYQISANNQVLMFTTQLCIADTLQTLSRVSLSPAGTMVSAIIWRGRMASSPVLSPDGSGIAFITGSDGNKDAQTIINYYNHKTGELIQLLNRLSPALDSSLAITSLSHFSLDGARLFLTIQEKQSSPQLPDVKVNIWSYNDPQIQFPRQGQQKHTYMAVINIKKHQFIRLQQVNEEWQPVSNNNIDDWALITYRKGYSTEESWNALAQPVYYLQSVSTGIRKVVKVPFTGISPAAKYLVGDDGLGNIFTLELATGVVRNVTSELPIPEGNAGYDKPLLLRHRGIGFWGHWLANDKGMILYDKYDLWLVDPVNIKPPVNLTGGCGRRNNITFRLIAAEGTVYNMSRRWILDAFDHRNKQNGFFKLLPAQKRIPDVLAMGPYISYAKEYFYLGGEKPLKASKAAVYIVKQGSAISAPNYYHTTDFIHFTPLSQVYPEQAYNWLQSKLVNFNTLNGLQEQGILYQPENFVPSKKYPLIITYYEANSERLYQYIKPAFSAGDINIPYFVSRGYLVLVPDIHFRSGQVGQDVYNTVAGAALYAARLPWVDSTKIGVTGRSFGGFETNYLITQCHLFAAACSDAGIADLTGGWSSYELNTGMGLQDLYERSYYRMNGPPWQIPEAYLKNSPIYWASQVTTPVLLIYNRLDAVVPFTQGIAFFTALRRSGKKVWLLQYEEEGHNLLKKENQIDLTNRITQFFDHYLKEGPAPEWMK